MGKLHKNWLCWSVVFRTIAESISQELTGEYMFLYYDSYKRKAIFFLSIANRLEQ